MKRVKESKKKYIENRKQDIKHVEGAGVEEDVFKT